MHEALTERESEVLCEVVELYLGCGEPVASRSVAEISRLSLSPASIRSIMAHLEDKGFLEQPHTSAGRVPSDTGLTVFLERLMRRPALPSGERQRLCHMLPASGTLEERLDHASRVLARLTRQVGMAVRPSTSSALVKSLQFVRVDERQVLAVLVTTGGVVESRLLAVEASCANADLAAVSNFCTETFAGLSLRAVRDRLAALGDEERTRCDRLVAAAVELADKATREAPATATAVFVQGVENLLARSGGEERDSLARMLAALSERTALLHLLDRFLTAAGPRVVLGEDLAAMGTTSMGMVVRSFQLAGGELGLVGVIGVRYMNYPYLVPVVDFVGQRMAEQWGGL